MAVINGTGGNDILVGTIGDDAINGLDGNDTLTGGSGIDMLTGGTGADTFSDTAAGLNGDTIVDFSLGESIIITDAVLANFTFSRMSNTTGSTLNFGGQIFLPSVPITPMDGVPIRFIASAAPNGGVMLTLTRDILGTAGNDILVGTSGVDVMNGRAGNDTLTGGTGNDVFQFYTMNDFTEIFGNDRITDFRQGEDKIDLSGRALGFASDLASLAPLISQVGNDTRLTFGRFGGPESITIAGILPSQLTAADFIFNTSPSAVVVSGSLGDDVLIGGLGNDTLTDNSGQKSDRNIFLGGAGNDRLVAGPGSDSLYGQSGADTFVITAFSQGDSFGDDIIFDFVSGQDKIDLSVLGVSGFPLIPFLFKNIGGNAVFTASQSGFTSSLTILGVSVENLAPQDFIFAGNITDGPDTVVATDRNDLLAGGGGADTFVFGRGENGNFATGMLAGGTLGNDLIADFVPGEDKIDLSRRGVSSFAQIQPFIVRNGADTLIGLRGESILLKNVLPSQLSAADFLFDITTTAHTTTGIGAGSISVSAIVFDSRGADTITVGGAFALTIMGPGNDLILSSSGSFPNIFVISAPDTGRDVIRGYNPGSDKLDVSALGIKSLAEFQAALTQDGPDTIFTVPGTGGASTVTFFDVLPTRFTASALFLAGQVTGIDYSGFPFATLFGTAYNDKFTQSSFGSVVDQRIWGGQGIDLAVLNGSRASATVTRNSDGTITTISRDGTDTYSGIELFQFFDGTFSFNFTNPGAPRVANFAVGAGGWSTQDRFPRQAADVNGDGRADIVGFGQAGTLVALGRADGTFADPVTAVANFGVDQGWTSDNIFHRELADVNGDGRADMWVLARSACWCRWRRPVAHSARRRWGQAISIPPMAGPPRMARRAPLPM